MSCFVVDKRSVLDNKLSFKNGGTRAPACETYLSMSYVKCAPEEFEDQANRAFRFLSLFGLDLGWGLDIRAGKKIGARPPPPGRHAIKYELCENEKCAGGFSRMLAMHRIPVRSRGRKTQANNMWGGADGQMCFSLLSPTQHVQSVYVLEMGVCVMYVHSTQYISCM